MDGMTWALIALLVALLAALAVLGVLLHRKRAQDARIEALHSEIAGFLQGGPEPEFSLEDGNFAALRCAVAEMAEKMHLAGENERLLAQQTAQMIADISHQLKTPLAGMRLYCEMDAEDGSESAKRQLMLIDQMEKMVLGLLKIEKLRANAYEMEFADGLLQDVCRAEIDQFAALYPDRQFSLEGGARVRFDARWMGEAIGNVVKNACEHTAENGHIALRIKQSEEFVWLSVTDDGGGVPAERLSGLFTRFGRAQSGSGLGLAITRSIMECHHGGADAQNTPQGLCILLYLPDSGGKLADMSLQ